MNMLRIAVIAGVVGLFSASESNAQSGTQLQLRPSGGFAVQALAWFKPDIGLPEGTFWITVKTFDTLEAAQDFEDYLMFLAFADPKKLKSELDFPNFVYLSWYDFRVLPLYSADQLIPRSTSPARAATLR